MMPTTLTCEEIRKVDQAAVERFGFSGLMLMENAGRGLADRLCRLGIHGPVVICCGKGNNAGDGFVLARHLDLRGYEPRVLLWAEPEQIRPDAAVNLEILRRAGMAVESFGDRHDPPRLAAHLDEAAWVVDALLGTGAKGDPRPPIDAVIDQLNNSGVPIMAVDLPSGLDADTGKASVHTISAVQTCTFLAAKPGFYTPDAWQHTGEVFIADIGVPPSVVERILAGDRDGS